MKKIKRWMKLFSVIFGAFLIPSLFLLPFVLFIVLPAFYIGWWAWLGIFPALFMEALLVAGLMYLAEEFDKERKKEKKEKKAKELEES